MYLYLPDLRGQDTRLCPTKCVDDRIFNIFYSVQCNTRFIASIEEVVGKLVDKAHDKHHLHDNE